MQMLEKTWLRRAFGLSRGCPCTDKHFINSCLYEKKRTRKQAGVRFFGHHLKLGGASFCVTMIQAAAARFVTRLFLQRLAEPLEGGRRRR